MEIDQVAELKNLRVYPKLPGIRLRKEQERLRYCLYRGEILAVHFSNLT